MAQQTDGAARVVPALDHLAGVDLPVQTLDEALPHLRRPFTPEAIRFKVQAAFPKGDPKGCVVVAYIDARLVIERLNAVVGGAWEATPQRIDSEPKLMWCHLTVCGTTRLDIGESPKGISKDLWSDALKRAAVPFGVGVSVYALPQITLYLDQEGGQPRIKKQGRGDKQTIVLTEHGHTKLREGYGKWLAEHGERLFGPALDHGDVEGQVVDEDDLVPEDDFVPTAPEPLADEKALALQEEAKRLYAELAEVPGAARQFAPATFQAYLQRSVHSHEALEQLVAYVKGRHEQMVPRGGAS